MNKKIKFVFCIICFILSCVSVFLINFIDLFPKNYLIVIIFSFLFFNILIFLFNIFNKKVLNIIGIVLEFILAIIILVLFLSPIKIPVLTYHDFTLVNPTNEMQINKDVFEEQMKYLSKMGYRTLKLKDIECFIESKCNLSRKSVLITIDDGWKSELEIALPILKKYNLNAVIFYLGENVDGKNQNFMNLDDLKRIEDEYDNIEIASHSYSLHYDDAYMLDLSEFVSDMKKMKKVVNSKYYAYPFGMYSQKYMEALEKEKYSLAFTFGQNNTHRKLTQKDNRYELPRLNFSTDMPLWKFVLRLNWYK